MTAHFGGGMGYTTSAQNSIYEGWERYPLNLPDCFSQYNLESCHRLLSKETERLFDLSLFSVQVETLTVGDGDEDGEMRRMTDHATTEAQLQAILGVKSPTFHVPCWR